MHKLISAFLFLLFFLNAGSQQIDSAIDRYGNDFQYEKAWLHYDKSSYFAGETIWFKAYVMEDLYPAQSSKTFYIDWIGDNGKLLLHTVSPLVEGTTNGQFEIPADYNGNFIHVRAYSKWMLNFDTSFLYQKDIRILPRNITANKPKKPSLITSLQFFPEGGDAVEGLINRIAFKANDQFGNPVNIKGTITDQKGNIIDSFRTVHDGMGSLILKPLPGTSYSAKWKDINGTLKTTALPQIRNTGISMLITNEDSKQTIIINASAQLTEPLKQVYLVGTMNQRMAFKTAVNLSASESVRRVIPTGNLPSGILSITVFDRDWNAIAERVTFVNNHEYRFETNMEVEHWGMGKRKRNEIEISIPEKLAGAALSISVTDAAIETDSSDNIISHFLLTSEVKGKVHNPAYYFSSNDKKVSDHLDLVMLTHGWRRFKWEDVVAGKFPEIKYPKDTSYLSLSGQLFGVAKSQLTGTDHIVLMVKEDTVTKMIIMPITQEGTFGDPGIILFDTMRVYYSLKSKFFQTAEARFMLNRLSAPDYSAFSKSFASRPLQYDTTGSYRHFLLAAESLRIQQLYKGEMMESVTVKAKQKTTVQEMDQKYASGRFQGDAHQFDLVNDVHASAYQSALQYLQGKVAGLIISGNPPSLSWRGSVPALFLDEISTDVSMITTIPVSDIAYIKVFRPPFLGASNGSGGAIAIYTRRGNDMNYSGAGLSTNKVAGYTPIREFYSPNYDRFDVKNEQPDMRTTLYWNPLVIANPADHKVRLRFYNNDVSSSFRVVIQGMSKEGLLTHFSQIME